jgi:hypothetical protein
MNLYVAGFYRSSCVGDDDGLLKVVVVALGFNHILRTTGTLASLLTFNCNVISGVNPCPKVVKLR